MESLKSSFNKSKQTQKLEEEEEEELTQLLHQTQPMSHPNEDVTLNINPQTPTSTSINGAFQDSTFPKLFSSKETRVSFNESSSPIRSRFGVNSDEETPHAPPELDTDGGGGGEAVARTPNASSLKRNSRSFKMKPKSRLLDAPPGADRRSVAKSGGGSVNGDGYEDESLFDEDLPEEYKKMNFNAFTFVQWVSLILIIAALVCSLSIRVVRKQTLWDLQLWKWEVMILVLICGRLVSGWGIRIIVFFIERNFLLRKRVLYFVYGLRKAVQNCIWFGLVLIAWHYILDPKVEKEMNSKILGFVTKLLVCLLVGTLIWLLKTLLVKVLASSFHVSKFFDRIQDALFNQYVIETLSGPPLIEMKNMRDEDERVMVEVEKLRNAGANVPADLKATITSGRFQKSPRGENKGSGLLRGPGKNGDEGITIDHLNRLNQWNISAWNMKRLMNIIRHGGISTLDEQILNADIEDESSMLIRSECQAKEAARKIFHNVASRGSKHIYLDNLKRFMSEDEALKTIHLFEGANENKGISKTALRNWVVNAFRDRRALAFSLKDTKTAVDELHHMLNILVGIIILIIWLIILGVAVKHFLVFISSQVLLVAFVFGNTCKTVFEALIFLFVMHPFDVGDRCEVDGVQMIVEEMNILTTVFLRYDNQKIIYPNSVLSTKPISNYYRSPDMGDAIDFCVHVSTPLDKIATMKERITRYIESKEDHWHPGPMIVMRDVEDMNRLKMSVWLTHTMNHQDMGERWVRRTLLVEEMIRVFRDLDIQYRMLPIDVNVRNMPGLISNKLPSNWNTCGN